MNIQNSSNPSKSTSHYLILAALLFSTDQLSFAGNESEFVRIKDNVKIHTSAGRVSLLALDNKGEKVEYSFTDFHADAVLLLYRRVDWDIMIKNLSKKYYLSKTDTRRNLKMTINTLEQWDLVSRE